MPGVPSATPAHENTTSTRPVPSSSSAASIDDRSPRFTWIACAPASFTSAKSMTTTSAPASCASSATAAPIPVAPPTTSARLPSYRNALNRPISCFPLVPPAAVCARESGRSRRTAARAAVRRAVRSAAMFMMRFDMRARDGGAPADALYAAALDMAAWGEEHGALALVLSEHHASSDGYLPSPIVLAAAMAGRTTTVPITVAALLVPLHDPVRLSDRLDGRNVGTRWHVFYLRRP